MIINDYIVNNILRFSYFGGSLTTTKRQKNILIIKYIEPDVFTFLFVTMFNSSSNTNSFTAREKLKALPITLNKTNLFITE